MALYDKHSTVSTDILLTEVQVDEDAESPSSAWLLEDNEDGDGLISGPDSLRNRIKSNSQRRENSSDEILVSSSSLANRRHTVCCSVQRGSILYTLLTAMLSSAFTVAIIFLCIIPALKPSPDENCTAGTILTVENKTSAKNVSACPANFPWSQIRLPKYVRPIRYDILLFPNLTSFTFSGNVNITLIVTQSTNTVILHSKELQLTQYSAYLLDNSESDGVRGELRIDGLDECNGTLEQVAFRFREPVASQSVLQLKIQFSGTVSTTFSGLYKSIYKPPDGNTEYSVVTQFEPTDARRMFPCFDEPAMKAVFKMSIVRDPNRISLSNMDLNSTEDYGSGLKVDHFNPTVKMSTYLLAVSVNNFGSIHNQTKSGTKVSIYCPKSQLISAHFALETAVAALNFFESFFNISFPLPKQDLLAFSDFAAGAMENWGLVTFRDYLLLYQQGRTTTSTAEFQAMVVVHELAHQWFGNLVTMEWWNDLWLNEGFATLMEQWATSQLHPSWNLMDDYYLDITAKSMYLDGFKSTHAISTEVSDPAEIGSMFDSVSYEKGGSILNMIMDLSGTELFQQGLQDYLTQYKYSNAQGKQLWDVLQNHLHLEPVGVGELAESWTHEIGYPFIEVKLGSDKQSITVQQKRFLYLQEQRNGSNPTQSWPIPLYYRSKASEKKIRWITGLEQVSIPVSEGDWVIFNQNGTGYYRILYDDSMYQRIHQQLQNDHTVFTPMERAVLLNDLFNMLRAGYIQVDTVLNAIQYAKNATELDVLPLKMLVLHLDYIEIILRPTELYEKFREFMRSLVTPYYSKFGWELPEDHQQRKMQIMIVEMACHLKIGDCVQKAKAMFAEWLDEPLKVPADHRKVVISTGIKYGNTSTWNTVFEILKRSDIPSEKETFIHALASTTDILQLNRYLTLSLDPSIIKPNLIGFVVGGVSSRIEGQLLAWKFVRSNWDKLEDILGKTTMLGRCLTDTTMLFSTQFELDEVVDFFKDKDLGLNKKRYEQAQEQIKLNMQWVTLHQSKLQEWVENWKNNQ